MGPGLLDFWLGRWDVYDRDGILAGHDVVELVLGGRAVLEHWRNREGREGKSLFWLEADGSWRQVWVTEGGIVKEKALVARNGGADVLFEGEAVLPDGRRLRDRTTLAPLADNHVWQLIEASEDDGETWETTFDAIYAPAD